MKKITVLLFLSLSVLMVSCGQQQTPPEATPPASPTTSPSP